MAAATVVGGSGVTTSVLVTEGSNKVVGGKPIVMEAVKDEPEMSVMVKPSFLRHINITTINIIAIAIVDVPFC